MISFLELHLENFRSWKRLDIINMNKLGLCSIQGDNGSGKSSLRQAIEYLLTDDISDGTSLDEIPFNKNTQAYMQCVLEKDDKEIVITKVCGGKKNTIDIKVDGDSSLTTTSRKETQKNIEMLLGINKDVLTTSMIFSQHAKSFPEAKESDRKAILYDALDLNKYNKYHEIANDKLDHIIDNSRTLEENIKFLEVQIKDLEDEISTLRVKEGLFSEEIGVKIEKLQEEALDKVNLIKDTPEPLDLFLEKEAAKLSSKLLIEECRDIPDQLEEVSNALMLNKQKLKSVSTSTCPILKCVCSLLEEQAEKIKMEVLPLQDPLEESYNFLKELQDKKYKEMNKLTQLYTELQNREVSRANEIASIEQQNIYLRSRLVQIEKEIESLKNIGTNTYTNLLYGKQTKLAEKNHMLAVSKEALTLLQEDQSYFTFWKKGFHKSGIPNMKVEGFLASLEDRTNNYLSSISDRMFVEIDSQRDLKSGGVKEEISYKVHNPDKDITDYHSYSGGERQRVKIANILAFSDLLGQMDIMILDEVLELSLDEDGKTSVLTLLKEKASDLGSIFIVTHSAQIQDQIDNVLKVSKVDGVSSLV